MLRADFPPRRVANLPSRKAKSISRDSRSAAVAELLTPGVDERARSRLSSRRFAKSDTVKAGNAAVATAPRRCGEKDSAGPRRQPPRGEDRRQPDAQRALGWIRPATGRAANQAHGPFRGFGRSRCVPRCDGGRLRDRGRHLARLLGGSPLCHFAALADHGSGNRIRCFRPASAEDERFGRIERGRAR